MSPEHKKFWMEVYVAVIRSGIRGVTPTYFADHALADLKERERDELAEQRRKERERDELAEQHRKEDQA